jgi:hypothetical protein
MAVEFSLSFRNISTQFGLPTDETTAELGMSGIAGELTSGDGGMLE